MKRPWYSLSDLHWQLAHLRPQHQLLWTQTWPVLTRSVRTMIFAAVVGAAVPPILGSPWPAFGPTATALLTLAALALAVNGTFAYHSSRFAYGERDAAQDAQYSGVPLLTRFWLVLITASLLSWISGLMGVSALTMTVTVLGGVLTAMGWLLYRTMRVVFYVLRQSPPRARERARLPGLPGLRRFAGARPLSATRARP